MAIEIVTGAVRRSRMEEAAKKQFGDMVKAVVDVSKEIMAIGGELHADEEALLMDGGSRQEDLWGINLYPESKDADWIEFDAMINLRPSQENRTRGVDNPDLRDKIRRIVEKLVVD